MKVGLFILMLTLGFFKSHFTDTMNHSAADPSTYMVHPVTKPILINGNWEKQEWREVPAIEIAFHMGETPSFSPKTEVKLRYDKDNIYGIFKVQDRYVQCLVQEINGPVSTDSCVEFFFSPDVAAPLEYFNLEINCSGVPLLHYVTSPRKEYKVLDPEDIRQIEIAHSMPDKVDPEIREDTTWYIEFKMPVSILKEHRNISTPAPGVTWKANFYKTGSKTSNPHYFTWNEVINDRPDFHLPRYFGNITFQ
ncbi:carbohydrate-binding family 9-like protein [Cyclobacterium plantarum]|uniref:Diguanylate cyclase n=1 Tax=Cyclobacterium plantarum TaxID=2716263 RepID=A0ABX0HFP7_9BACT|nr:carbohydrate-binding family 9-like protein [Cyclobacterium plantarum]NHE59133.1 diguanylate cyclase [Cyclobacterium plantarum]